MVQGGFFVEGKGYCSYDRYSVIYDKTEHQFCIFYGQQKIIGGAYAEGIYQHGKKDAVPADFPVCELSYAREKLKDSAVLTVSFAKEQEAPAFLLRFHVSAWKNGRLETFP